MEESFVTNNYFINCVTNINQYMSEDKEVPEELFINFVNELSVSNLLIPGNINDDDLNFEVLTSEDDQSNVLPLFSDDDVFQRYYDGDSQFNPFNNDIQFYLDLLRENNLDGILINPGTDDLFLDKELLFQLPLNIDFEIGDNFEGYSADKLYDISRQTTNESLVKFMRSDDDHFEALMLELTKAVLLNVVVSPVDLSAHADNGVLSIDEVGDLPLCTTGDDDIKLGVLFTSVDAIKDSLVDDGLYYYYQITLLDEFMEFILKNDMDGLLIDPGDEDYLISREYLLEAYRGLSYNNPSFKKAMNYMFLL